MSAPTSDPHFTGDPEDDRPHTIDTPEGWNYMVRLYRPRPACFDGTSTVPSLTSPGGWALRPGVPA